MKAKVYFSAPDRSGDFMYYDPAKTYQQFCNEVGDALVKSNGWGWLVGGSMSIPLRYITRTVRMEG